MWSVLEEKHFQVGFLLMAAAILGHFGLNLDVAQLAVILGPLTAIAAAHAHGAASAAATNAKQQTVQQLADATSQLLASFAPPISAPTSQRGFVRGSLVCFLALASLGGYFAIAAAAGCSATQRTQVIAATLTTLDSAEVALQTYDKATEDGIVAGAASLADGQAKLSAVRAKVWAAEAGIEAGYRLAALAGIATDEPSLTTFTAAATSAIAAVAAVVKGTAP